MGFAALKFAGLRHWFSPAASH